MNVNERAGSRRCWLLAACAACVLGLSVPAANAQESGGPEGQGRNSKPDEEQKSAAAQPAAGVLMPGSLKLEDGADRPVPGRPPSVMERLIKRPGPVLPGELGPVGNVTTAQPTLGGGQTKPVLPPRPTKSFLKLVVRVKSDGSSEVLSATEMAGDPPISEESIGDYLYEVADGDATLTAQSIVDPFEAHSFGGPQDEKEGHYELRSEEATIVVTVPGRSLASPMTKLSLHVYKLKAGVVPERVNAASVRKLKADNQLETVVSSPAAKLAPEIKRRGVKLQ